jgi:hypothetical protein
MPRANPANEAGLDSRSAGQPAISRLLYPAADATMTDLTHSCSRQRAFRFFFGGRQSRIRL